MPHIFAMVDVARWVILLGALILPLGLAALHFLRFPLRKHFAWGLILGLGLGEILLPAFLFVVGHFFAIGPLTVFGASYGLAALLFCARREKSVDPQLPRIFWSEKLFLAALSAWLVFQISVQFLQPGGEAKYYSIVYDYIKHDGVIFSLANSKLPPSNPFFYPGHPVRLSYYYLFHLLPAGLAPWTASSYHHLFAAVASITAIAVLLLFFAWIRLRADAKVSWVSSLLLVFFSGFDCAPAFGALRQLFDTCNGSFLSCWWNAGLNFEFRFVGFTSTIVYAPHHVLSMAGLFAVAIGHKLFADRKEALILLPWFALGCIGSSVYIGAFGLLVAAAVFLKNRRAFSWKKASMPVVGTILLLLWLAWEIRPHLEAMNQGFDVRPLIMFPKEAASWLDRWWILFGYAFNAFPFVFLLALGRQERWSQAEVWEKFAIVAGLFLCMTITSRGTINDFSIRVLCLVRAVAIGLIGPECVRIFTEKTRWKLAVVLPFFLLGAIGSLNHMAYWGWVRMQVQSNPSQATEDYIAMSTFLSKHTPASSIVQGPVRDVSRLLLYSRRKSALLDDVHGSLFNVSRTEWNWAKEKIQVGKLRELGVDYWIVKNEGTPKSAGSDGLEQVFENQRFRVLKIDH
jgi:hypothetical protein